jgi:hypothetical protein
VFVFNREGEGEGEGVYIYLLALGFLGCLVARLLGCLGRSERGKEGRAGVEIDTVLSSSFSACWSWSSSWSWYWLCAIYRLSAIGYGRTEAGVVQWKGGCGCGCGSCVLDRLV